MAYTIEETKELMRRVLEAYVSCGVIGLACDKAGVRRKLHQEWLEKHPSYKVRFEEMRERFVDGLESVAIQRAKDKSDSLLMFLLKAEKREKYGDKADVALSGQLAGPPVTLVFAEGMLSEEEKKLMNSSTDKPGDGEDANVKVD